MKCSGNGKVQCPDSKSGQGVKKTADGLWRCDDCQQNSTTTPEAQDAATPSVIINKLICFLYTYTNEVHEQDLKKICLNFYNAADINSAHDVLLKSYTGDKSKIPIHDDTSKSNEENALSVIIDLLAECDRANISATFVAHDLTLIPAVQQDKIDIMALFKDMNLMRNRLDRLQRNTAVEFTRVKEDITLLNNKVSSAAKPPAPKTTTKPTVRTEQGATNSVPEKTKDTAPPTQFQWSDDEPTDDVNQTTGTYADAAKKATDAHIISDDKPKPRRSRRVIATGENKVGLAASTYSKPEELFVSYLGVDFTERSIINYIKVNTGIKIGCQQIETRYDEKFLSFKVIVDKEDADELFDPNVWPSKTVIDYYNPPRKRNYRKNNRSSNSRRNTGDRTTLEDADRGFQSWDTGHYRDDYESRSGHRDSRSDHRDTHDNRSERHYHSQRSTGYSQRH